MTAGGSDLAVLLSPLDVGPLRLRNRVVLAPHSTHYADRLESAALGDYYAERAAGGVALIVHEPVVVHPSSRSRRGKIWGYDPANVAAYRRTTDRVHELGAAIVCQLLHNGRQVDGHESGMPAWYPSAVSRPGTSEFTHEMSRDEIAEVVAGFAASARICREGGFDGVEVHAGHGYLLQAFLSPATNRRRDEYGGSLADRARLLREVLAAVRRALGPAGVLGVRLSGDEHQPGGLGVAEAVEVVRLVAPEVDYLSVVTGSLASPDRIVPDMTFPRAFNGPVAATLRAAAGGTPVLVTGRIAEPADGERLLAEGAADLVGVTRAMIADPDWLANARAGHHHRTRPCVYANDCRDAISGRRALTCMVNPDVGRPRTAPATRTPRRVVVVGGGVAGLEAAVTAASAGDRVVLLEATDAVGGQLLLAGAAPLRRELLRLPRHLVQRVAELGVDVRTGTIATPDLVAGLSADLVVLATGATEAPVGDTTGLGGWAVLAGAQVPTEHVVLHDAAAGNGWPFLAVADVLLARGHRVTLVTGATSLGTAVEAGSLPPLLRRLRDGHARVRTGARVVGSGPQGVELADATGAGELVAGASLVVEPGRRAATGLRDALSGLGAPVLLAGDVLAPRRVATAIREGRAAVRD